MSEVSIANYFSDQFIYETIKIHPKNINKDYKEYIENDFIKSLEGKCSKYGYIEENSVKLEALSPGQIESQNFNGYIIFKTKCSARICNPPKGSVIKVKVESVNKFGIRAISSINDVIILDIIIAKKTIGINSEIDLDEIKVGEEIYVEIIGKKFKINDNKISAIGRVLENTERKEEILNLIEEDKEEILKGGDYSDEENLDTNYYPDINEFEDIEQYEGDEKLEDFDNIELDTDVLSKKNHNGEELDEDFDGEELDEEGLIGGNIDGEELDEEELDEEELKDEDLKDEDLENEDLDLDDLEDVDLDEELEFSDN